MATTHKKIRLGVDPETGSGGVEVVVYPQKHTRITRKIGQFVGAFNPDMFDDEGRLKQGIIAADGIGPRTYDALSVMITQLPKRLSRWQFCGYSSAELMAAGGEPDDETNVPTIPEILEAFKAIFEVNGGQDFIDLVKGLVDPKLFKAELSIWISEELERLRSTPSQSSPGTSGESTLNGSGTTLPTKASSGSPEEMVAGG